METAQRVLESAAEKKMTVCSCESLTAGLFCDTLASCPGASRVLKGGLVTYFTQMKTVLAHVPASLIETYGVISEECARAMAENTRTIMSADWCVSFTGNAGPDTMENKPAGEIWCAIAGKEKTQTFHLQLKGLSRNAVRKQAVSCMMEKLLELIEEN